MFIWRSLLKLPENHAAYSSLVDKGTHNAFARLHEEYPIKSRKLLRVLQRLVELCIRWWSKVLMRFSMDEKTEFYANDWLFIAIEKNNQPVVGV